ncbi:hypothetical protein E8E13_004827 [Curvularia kusanoi]|uniref:Uncharacterized protein n=1 Tax=Curvularia kusanoi TaxID=90978 RepID=A0A9P4T603_CURKU|nr:hypothetical protein E8E13_004827 [Curvularia kusanoi]
MARADRVQTVAATQQAGNKGTANAAAGQQDRVEPGERGARSVESRVEVVEYALCRDFNIKEKLKIHRAVSKSIIAAIEEADGFKYSERHSHNPKNGDGVRLRYVCQDSLENRDRKANKKKKETDPNEIENETARTTKETYDCGGAIYAKFSAKRDAINVVYKHNPIHRDVQSRRNGNTDIVDSEANAEPSVSMKTPNGSTKKRRRTTKDRHTSVDEAFHDPDLDMSTSPEAPKSSARRKRKSNGADASAEASKKSKAKKNQVSKTTKTLSTAKAKKDYISDHLWKASVN